MQHYAHKISSKKMSPENVRYFFFPFQQSFRGSVFQSNDERMFEIGDYAYFTLI